MTPRPIKRADAWSGLVHACLYEETLPAVSGQGLVYDCKKDEQARSLVEQWSSIAVEATLDEGWPPEP